MKQNLFRGFSFPFVGATVFRAAEDGSNDRDVLSRVSDFVAGIFFFLGDKNGGGDGGLHFINSVRTQTELLC